MANTLLRIGYVSGSGGGAISQYPDFASFPPTGSTNALYCALDTAKLYVWDGTDYVEASPSLVTSVNTQVGDVVLDKADIGLDQVDNTSDADKPISDDTQAALDAITDISWTGSYNNGVTYSAGQGVMYNGASYVMTATIGAAGYIPPAYPGNWRQVTDYVNPHDIGLGNVDNTSDLDKPVSNDVQDALDLKEDTSNKSLDVVTDQADNTKFPSVKAVYDWAVLTFQSVLGYTAANENLSNLSSTAVNTNINPDSDNVHKLGDSSFNWGEINARKLIYDATGANIDLQQAKMFDATGNRSIDYQNRILTDSADISSIDYNLHTLKDSAGSDSLDFSGISAVHVLKDLNVSQRITCDVNAATSIQIQGTGGGGSIQMPAQSGAPSAPLSGFRFFADSSGYPSFKLTNNKVVTLSTAAIIADATFTFPSTTGVLATTTYVDTGVNTRIPLTQKGAANGVAPLNSSSKIDSTYLPAYVDDVLEFANLASFPVTGSTGIIYVAIDTNLCYRWSGSTYIEISPAPVTSVNGQTNAVSLDASDIPFTPTSTILSTDTQSAIVEVEGLISSATTAIYQDTKEPTGFVNRTDSTVSFIDGSRTLTIQPVSTSFSFYIKGIKFTKNSPQSVTITNQAGNHYIYFNTSGNLVSTQIFSTAIIEENAYVAIVYWNTDTNTHTYFAEERHGITMDGATHIYLHTTFGSRYISGLALQGFTANGDGTLNTHAQFTADAGSIRDEDILLASSAQTQIPILFRQGQLWRKKTADAFPLIYSGTAGYTGANGRIPFNEFVAGSWQLTEVPTNNYVLVHFFATNDKENPIVGIQGIAQYNNKPQASAAASSEITSLTGLPFAEFVAIGTVIFETDTYTNTPNARVVSVNSAIYIDFRGTQLYTPAGTATTHSLLSGLSNDDHIQYHTDARGDIRYYTKSQVDSLISGITSPGDLDESSFSINNSEVIPANITGLAFANATVRSFQVLASVYINATSSLYEEVKISGIQKGSDWDISVMSTGDESGVQFSITSSGQLQYISSNYSGFVSGSIKFRALTTSI